MLLGVHSWRAMEQQPTGNMQTKQSAVRTNTPADRCQGHLAATGANAKHATPTINT
jgi:hypothetical protein